MDVWSNHACQVALFFPSVRTACSGGSIRSSPASGNAPLGNQGTREPTGCVISKATKAGHFRWSCCHWIGQGMHPNSLDKVRVRAVGPSCSQRATSNVPGNRGGLKKSKDKGKRSKQRRIAKRRNERPSTHPEKNRQRPPDHQARRRSRKETHPFPKWRKTKGQGVIVQHEDKSG